MTKNILTFYKLKHMDQASLTASKIRLMDFSENSKFDNLNDVLSQLTPNERLNVIIKGSFAIIFALLSFWALIIFSILLYKLCIIQDI